jgi:hypothetical protein
MTQHLNKDKMNDKVGIYSEVDPNRPNIFINSQCIYLNYNQVDPNRPNVSMGSQCICLNSLSTSYDPHLLNVTFKTSTQCLANFLCYTLVIPTTIIGGPLFLLGPTTNKAINYKKVGNANKNSICKQKN